MTPAARPAARTRVRQCLYWLVPVREDTMRATPSPQTRMAPHLRGRPRYKHTPLHYLRKTGPLGVSHHPPGVVSDAPWVQNTPGGVCKHPRGWFRGPSGYEPPPGAREAVPGGDRC